jgi:hypothetical protein
MRLGSAAYGAKQNHSTAKSSSSSAGQDPEGTRLHLGALLRGYYTDEGKLIYAGRVGTGMPVKVLAEQRRCLDPLARKTTPLAGTDPIPDLVLSHLLREQEPRRTLQRARMPPTGASFEGLAYRGTRQMRSRVRQNTTSAKVLNPLAWTPARTPCILYAGRRIPRQFQLKDGWTCAAARKFS